MNAEKTLAVVAGVVGGIVAKKVIDGIGSAPKKPRQRKIKIPGQPAPRWPQFLNAAVGRIAQRGGFKSGLHAGAIEQIAQEIIRGGEGEAFLKSVRRGRPTSRQNVRYQLLRSVEEKISPAVPRRREDRNTPEAVRSAGVLTLSRP